jgi:hypothetical protein
MRFAFRSFDYADSSDVIESILKVKSSSNTWFSWDSNFEEDPEYLYLTVLFNKLEQHAQEVVDNDINLNDFCLWLFIDKEIVVQQNFEFSPKEQLKLAGFGITLCISA